MRRLSVALLAPGSALCGASLHSAADDAAIGRWDMTLQGRMRLRQVETRPTKITFQAARS